MNYVKHGPTFVEKLIKMVSWRGLGEVLGALGVPFRLPFGMCFCKKIVFFFEQLFDMVVDAILYPFWSIYTQCFVFFWMKTGI